MKIRRMTGLVAKKIDKEFIVFNTNKCCFYELNLTAEVIWKLLNRTQHIEEIVNKIKIYFETQNADVEKDVLKFIKQYQNSLFHIKN